MKEVKEAYCPQCKGRIWHLEEDKFGCRQKHRFTGAELVEQLQKILPQLELPVWPTQETVPEKEWRQL